MKIHAMAKLSAAIALLFLLVVPEVCAFECVPGEGRVRIEGLWRDRNDGGEIRVACRGGLATDASGPRPWRNCLGVWHSVRGAAGYRPGEVLFFVHDANPAVQWDGCKLFTGTEIRPGHRAPPPGQVFPRPGHIIAGEITILLARKSEPPASAILSYAVKGRPGEHTVFTLVAPEGWQP